MGHTNFKPYIADFLAHSLNTKGFELIPLAGDASARRYCRVVHGNDSFVLMIWDPFKAEEYPFLSVLNHFARHNVHVPKVKDYSEKAGLVLLEDLGDLTLERKFWENQNQEMVMPFYKQAIDELVKIHYKCSEDRSNPCTAFNIEFDTEKLLWEMNYGREQFIEKFCNVKLSGKEMAGLTNCFVDICERLHREPKFICHRDYHSRNLMLKLGNMRVIDFQDARMGPIQYDLVSLVHDSYVQLSDESINEILVYYMSFANEYLLDKLDPEQFFEVFELQLIQRCFKACGSFASFFNLRGDKRYLRYIPSTIEKVVHRLKEHKEFQPFYNVIVDHGLMDREYELT